MVGFFVFLFIFLFACSSIVNAGQWKLTVRIDGNIYWAIHCVGGLGKLVVGGKCASSGPQNRFYIWKLIVGCCRRLYFLRLPFCWQSWGCDNCRAGCNVVSEYAALLQVLQLSLDFSLVNCPLQRGRGGGHFECLLHSCCFARNQWSIFSWDVSPGYTQVSPTQAIKILSAFVAQHRLECCRNAVSFAFGLKYRPVWL